MVTAKGTEIDTVVALEMGADDYVTKPYRLRELVAQIRAVLRRAPVAPTPSSRRRSTWTGRVWESSGIKMDFDQRRAFVRGEEVHLRRKEFELLRLLIENSGRVLTRNVLMDRVWGTDYIGDTKTLDVHIKRLRCASRPTPPRCSSPPCGGRLPLRLADRLSPVRSLTEAAPVGVATSAMPTFATGAA